MGNKGNKKIVKSKLAQVEGNVEQIIHPIHFVRFFEKSFLSRFKYPKILLFILVVLLAYFCFQNNWFAGVVPFFGEMGYLGIIIFGILFSFGFTAPIAVGFFVSFNAENIFLIALIGGFGAMIGDLIILRLIKFSFQNELDLIRKENLFKEFSKLVHHTLGKKITSYVSLALAGFLISSPMPNEIGVTIISGIIHIKERNLAIISFVFNTFGIFLMLSI